MEDYEIWNPIKKAIEESNVDDWNVDPHFENADYGCAATYKTLAVWYREDGVYSINLCAISSMPFSSRILANFEVSSDTSICDKLSKVFEKNKLTEEDYFNALNASLEALSK